MEYDKAFRTRELILEGHISGVRANCHGDLMFIDRAIFEPCKVAHDFFNKADQHLVPVAEKLGFPLAAHSNPYPPSWKDRKSEPNGLHYAMNLALAGLNPNDWLIGMYSVSIARKDKKPLHVAHVEALFDYPELLGGSPMEAELKVAGNDVNVSDLVGAYETKGRVILERACKEHFKSYLKEWMEKIGRPRHGDVGSPYDLYSTRPKVSERGDFPTNPHQKVNNFEAILNQQQLI
jgi:hypothetical protein